MRFVNAFAFFIAGSLAIDLPGLDPALNGSLTQIYGKEKPKEPSQTFSPETGVTFELFTIVNPTEPQIISPLNIATIKASNFNANNPTRFFIHGWKSKGRWTPRFADSYLLRGKHTVNFIAVNWSKASSSLNYAVSRKRVNSIGPYVARLINLLVQNMGAKHDDIHIIGHSLGAHIAGIAGKHVTGGKLAKIVGLDPASPLFNYDLHEWRLHHGDAKYVESIQTNSARLGFLLPIGHASFYPNGGRVQPGCGWDPAGICSHKRSTEFFLESLYSDVKFYGVGCESLESLRKGVCQVVNKRAAMGGEPGNLRIEPGIYYMQTNSQSPYATGGNAN